MHAVVACGGGTPLASELPPLLEPDPELPPLLEPDPELVPLSVPPSPLVTFEPPHAAHETEAGTARSDRGASARREGAVVSMPLPSIVMRSISGR
jgi:hypothetical protein